MSSGPSRIDVQHHLVTPRYVAALKRIGREESFGLDLAQKITTQEEALAFMDRNGIQAAVTSFSTPGFHFGDRDFTTSLCRACNEEQAQWIADHPTRFGAWAALPLPHVDASLREIEFALDTLGLDGVLHFSSYHGPYMGNPMWEEVYAELDRRGAVLYLHPEDPEVKPLEQYPPFMFYARFDTTMAIYNYIYSGMAERYPNITVVAAHGGGAAPNLSFISHASGLILPDGMKNAPKGLETYMKRMYYDTGICASPHALACLDAFVGASKLVFASDYPFAPEVIVQQGIENTDSHEGFDEEAQRRINRDNALGFLPRLSKRLG